MISVSTDIGYWVLPSESQRGHRGQTSNLILEMEGQLLDIKKNFFFGLWSI